MDGTSVLIRDNFLANIDLATAETTRVGQTSNSTFAVELINGTFYAAANNGIVSIIDEQGRLDELHDFGSQAFRGLTVIPAPSAALILGGAMGGFAGLVITPLTGLPAFDVGSVTVQPQVPAYLSLGISIHHSIHLPVWIIVLV